MRGMGQWRIIGEPGGVFRFCVGLMSLFSLSKMGMGMAMAMACG